MGEIKENREYKIALLQGDIDRIIMALENWDNTEDIIDKLKPYASVYMGGEMN